VRLAARLGRTAPLNDRMCRWLRDAPESGVPAELIEARLRSDGARR